MKTQRSEQLFAEAQRIIPGGVNSPVRAFRSVGDKDAKTTLQEHMQSLKLDLPEYIVLAVSGLAHRQKFMVECVIAKLNIRVVGEGTSRRRAEQDAARQAYALATQSG